VVRHIEGRIAGRNLPTVVVGSLALEGVTVFGVQLDSGLIESESIAHDQARHPAFGGQVLFRSVDRLEDIKLVLVPKSQVRSTIN
jgi:hypothetical protein